MELEFFGGNCLRIKTKNTVITVDDNLSKLGKKPITNDKSVAFFTSSVTADDKAADKARLVVATPGEFEVGDVTVHGVQARGHMDGDEAHSATVFQFMHGGQTISVLGHIHPNISDEISELVSGTDVLVVPVGGNGFTLDAVGATNVIKATEPDMVVPTQFADSTLNFEVPAAPLEDFLKSSGLSVGEEGEQDVLKLSKMSVESSKTVLVVLRAK